MPASGIRPAKWRTTIFPRLRTNWTRAVDGWVSETTAKTGVNFRRNGINRKVGLPTASAPFFPRRHRTAARDNYTLSIRVYQQNPKSCGVAQRRVGMLGTDHDR